ncbi:DUF4817 domain-containing protein [Trichonephila clavipes]|nr:DUF4817 domain-containing protein [Trichonephila clavipes]
MEPFTNTELADMHLIYGLAEGNARAAERLFREWYLQKDASDLRMFGNSHPNLCEYGSLRGNRHSEDGSRVTRTPNMLLEFLRTVYNTFCWNKMYSITWSVG